VTNILVSSSTPFGHSACQQDTEQFRCCYAVHVVSAASLRAVDFKGGIKSESISDTESAGHIPHRIGRKRITPSINYMFSEINERQLEFTFDRSISSLGSLR
jgi:hypothetical protein